MVDELAVPSEDERDRAIRAVKMGFQLIPFVGGAMAEFTGFFETPFAKRQERWAQSVVDMLLRLDNIVGGGSAAAILEDPQFITLLIAATRAALATHQEEKLRAIRAVLSRQALGHPSTFDVKMMYLSTVEQLTASHIEIIDCLTRKRQVGEVSEWVEEWPQLNYPRMRPSFVEQHVEVEWFFLRQFVLKHLPHLADPHTLNKILSDLGRLAVIYEVRESGKKSRNTIDVAGVRYGATAFGEGLSDFISMSDGEEPNGVVCDSPHQVP